MGIQLILELKKNLGMLLIFIKRYKRRKTVFWNCENKFIKTKINNGYVFYNYIDHLNNSRIISLSTVHRWISQRWVLKQNSLVCKTFPSLYSLSLIKLKILFKESPLELMKEPITRNKNGRKLNTTLNLS